MVISGHGNIESAVRAIKMGAFDFVEKPLSLEKTVLVVRNAIRQRTLEAENRDLRARVDRRLTMVGDSDAMVQLREQVAMAAPTNGRVLSSARTAPARSSWRAPFTASAAGTSGPFIEVNCAAIPEELIEIGAVRPRPRRVHRRGDRPARASSRPPTAGRSSSTRSAT